MPPKDAKRQEHGAASSQAGTTAADKWSSGRLGESHVAYLDFAADVEQRRQNGQHISSVYRIYLRDCEGNVASGHTIAIESDDAAIKIATVLCQACAEVAARYEVWKGEVLLTVGRAVAPSTGEMPLQHAEQIAIDKGFALRDSHAALAGNRRPLDAIDERQEDDPAALRRRAK